MTDTVVEKQNFSHQDCLSYNETGSLTGMTDYEAFGKPVIQTGSFASESAISDMLFGYTGKPYNATTGLSDYGYRDYSPQLARFTTSDPVRDGSNWYAYVNSDPIGHVDLWGLTANDQKQNNTFYDDYGRTSKTPYVVTGRHMGEQIDPVQVNIDIVFGSEKNQNGAVKGILTVYWATYSDVQKGYKGTPVVSVPVVSGGNDFAPTPAGTYENLKAEKTSTSGNSVLSDSQHGGSNNIMVRLPSTGGDAIHEGNIDSNLDRAYTEGCTAVTADLSDEKLSDVSANYDAFKKAIQLNGNTGVKINATVRYN